MARKRKPALFGKNAGDQGWRVTWSDGAGMRGQSGLFFWKANAEKRAASLKARGYRDVRVQLGYPELR